MHIFCPFLFSEAGEPDPPGVSPIIPQECRFHPRDENNHFFMTTKIVQCISLCNCLNIYLDITHEQRKLLVDRGRQAGTKKIIFYYELLWHAQGYGTPLANNE
jgi:hypothetical protein